MNKPHLQSLFQFGTPAIYFDSTGKTTACRVFIDTGWREPMSGFESHPAELITIVSILLEDVPVPRMSDQIIIGDIKFSVTYVQAQDEAIAGLYVKRV